MDSCARFFTNLALVFYYWMESIFLLFIPDQVRRKNIKGQNVLITGGGEGLGRALAIKLSRLGGNIVLWDIDEVGLAKTVELVKVNAVKCKSYKCDVSDAEAVYETAKQVRQDVGQVDLLINNAGYVSGKKILKLTDDEIKKTFQVNTLAHFWTIRAFLPDMMTRNEGHIVSIASIAGHNGAAGLSDYSASKFAVVGLDESLKLELMADGYDGIKMTSICPFFIRTDMFKGVSSGLLPILNLEATADEVIDAVRTDRSVLLIPRVFYFLQFFKVLVPFKSVYYGYEALNLNNVMSTFTGKKAIESKNNNF